MAENFEKIGFEVDATDKASSVFDKIIERLEKMQSLSKQVGNLKTTHKANSNTRTEKDKLIAKTEKLKEQAKLLNSEEYKEATTLKLVNNEIKKQVEARISQQLGILKTTKKLSNILPKLLSVVAVGKKVARIFKIAFKESASYVENLNLFAVAYGKAYQETYDWALDLAQGFGVANNEIIKFAGTFRQLASSLGVMEDTATSASKTLTQLGYDFSALFNTSISDAMEALQSSIFSGQVRPLRRYGIDISQRQIDELLKTNETLNKFGASASSLNQSEKVLARLIITLRDGSNAFGVMNTEINNLESQIRILQASFSNFKLAIGDLLYEPAQQALVVLNALLIAITNVVRAFVPIKEEDTSAFSNIALGAEDANEEIDELNKKITTFDKFNVLGGQSNNAYGNSSLANALTEELKNQQAIYEATLSNLSDINNEAVQLAKRITDAFVITDEEGKFVDWTTTAKVTMAALVLAVGALGVESLSSLGKTKAYTRALIEHTAALKENTAALKGTYGEMDKLKNSVTGTQIAYATLSTFMAIGGLVALWSSEASAGEKLTHTFIGIAAAITAAAIAVYAFKKNWAQALNVAATVATGYFTVASMANTQGFADGGYTNANFIMTHENGKSEWVGKAAGSRAIVNDTQMSDIMKGAVAQGTYNALMEYAQRQNAQRDSQQPIKINIGGQEVFTAVRSVAKRQGLDFAKV